MKQIFYQLFFFTTVGLFFHSVPVAAQNMNSPYSVYGIGDIDHRSYDRTSGVAGAGLAKKSSTYIIDNNPASISGLDRSFLVVGLSIGTRSSVYKGDVINSENNRNSDMWIKKMSLGIKINKRWASSVGFSQFSNVNYKLTGSKSIDGSTDTYPTLYEGNGGLNDYHWANAISLGKHFSVGVRSSVIAGAINQTETLYEPNTQTDLATKQQDYFSNLRFQYGALYTASLSKQWDISLGGKYARITKLLTERSLNVTQDDAVIVDEKIIKYGRFSLPATYAAGIALTHKNKTTFLADYTYEDWNALQIKGSGWRMVSSHKLAAGAEFSKPFQYLDRSIEKKYYQLGAFINNSNLQVRGKPINEFGFTAGMGGWLGNNLLYAVSGEVGVRGTTSRSLIKENYFQLTFSFSYRDFLFSKGRKYD